MASSDDSSNSIESYTFAYAHGTVMVFSWMFFAPTGILIGRYGRLLRIGGRRKLLGETIWFQVHRLALSLTAFATLLGFFLILVQTQATWIDINSDGQLLFTHSILGILIVCFATVQVWMALFRCHPDSRFRFIYNWAHRITGLLAFLLSIPTIFIIAYWLPSNHSGLVAILSLWTAWVVIVVIAFECLQYQSRKRQQLSNNHCHTRANTHEMRGTDHQPNDVVMNKEEDLESDTINKAKLVLFGVHGIISIALVIPLIVLIWQQG